ncbi:FliH/SctL family protein [Buchnera aphidicola (Kurisakia onigurumii)]|uniref:FliH/SctL family protein n=1 Tax=Buchnera aphidicola TaxID=9 RepID=UPI0031B70A7D
MSKNFSKKNWIRWYPEKINFLKNESENHNNESDLNIKKKSKKKKINYQNNLNKKNELILMKEKNNIYQQGFKEGKNYALKKLNNTVYIKLENLFFDFQKSLKKLDKVFSSYILKLSLKILKDIIGIKEINTQDFLEHKIKKIIQTDFSDAIEKKIIIHPKNKLFVDKKLKKIIKMYNWKIIYKNDIPVEGCKIISEIGNVDATLNGLWKDLYRVYKSEDNII